MPRQADQTLTVRQQQNLRAKAAESASGVLTRLKECVHGDRRMTGTQIQAARLLLERVLPALSSVVVDHQGEGGIQINIVRHSQPPGAHEAATLGDTIGGEGTGAPRALQAVVVDGQADLPQED